MENKSIPKSKKVFTIIRYFSLLALMLVTGVFYGNWISLSRSYHGFSPDELSHIARVIIENLAMPMRFISTSCLLLMTAATSLLENKRSKEFYLSVLAILLTLSAILITVLVEVPINNQVVTWTSATAPEDWKQRIARWQMFNNIRTVASVLSFVFYSYAMFRPLSLTYDYGNK